MPPRLGDPVWRAAPTVLLRFRSLFAALAVGAFLVTVVGVAYPVFLSASESDLVASAVEAQSVTPFGMGYGYRSTDVRFTQRAPSGDAPLWGRRGDVFRREASRSELLGPTDTMVLGGVVTVTDEGGAPPPTGEVEARLFAGTGSIDHIEVLDGTEGPGVWLPDLVATPLAVGPGDEVVLHAEGGDAPVVVDGVYASLYTQPRQGYWRLFDDDVYPCPQITCTVPPQFVLADLDQLLELSAQLGLRGATFAWQAPAIVDPPLTLAAADELATTTGHLMERMSAGGDLAPLFRCCGPRYLPGGATEVMVSRNAHLVVQEVRQRIAAVQGPMLVLVVVGLAIALGVVAAAGVFSAVGRRVEIGVLTIRGWGPGAFGTKSALEAALPAAVGGLAGWAAATVLVATVGPGGPVSPGARTAAAVAAVLGVVTSIAIVGVVSGAAFVSRHEHRRRLRRALVWVPWELAAFAAAWVLARRLEAGGVEELGGIQRPRAEVFLFPLAVALGAGILCARVARLVLRHGTRGGTGAGPSWLVVRRLRSGSALTSLFLVAGVLTLSVATAALGTVASLRTTVQAKAEVFVGSRVQVQVVRGSRPAAGFPYPTTTVDRLRDAGSIDGGDLPYDLLVVDPDGFAAAAYWNDAFSDEPLDDLLGRLDADDGGDGRLPVVVAGGEGVVPSTVTLGREEVPVDVVGRATTFPGTSSDLRPLLVVARSRLEETFRGLPDPTISTPRATTEVWIDGPAPDVLDRLDELDVRPQLVITADEVEEIPFIDAAVQTFLVMQVLGFSAVALLVVIAVVYLYAKQRGRAVATVLSDRMGVRAATMRLASIEELGAMLAVALVVGVAVGVVSISVVVPRLDPLASIPPDPLIVVPAVSLVTTAVCLGVAAFAGGAIADRGARRATIAEVMRVAE